MIILPAVLSAPCRTGKHGLTQARSIALRTLEDTMSAVHRSPPNVDGDSVQDEVVTPSFQRQLERKALLEERRAKLRQLQEVVYCASDTTTTNLP